MVRWPAAGHKVTITCAIANQQWQTTIHTTHTHHPGTFICLFVCWMARARKQINSVCSLIIFLFFPASAIRDINENKIYGRRVPHRRKPLISCVNVGRKRLKCVRISIRKYQLIRLFTVDIFMEENVVAVFCWCCIAIAHPLHCVCGIFILQISASTSLQSLRTLQNTEPWTEGELCRYYVPNAGEIFQ